MAMTTMSSALGVLRLAAQEQRAIYAAYRKAAARIRRDEAADPDFRLRMLHKNLASAREQLGELAARCAQAQAQITAEAEKRRVAATPEGRAKVEKALATGWTLHDLCQQLVAEGDRAAISALKDYLPYGARAGSQLEIYGPKGDYDKQVKGALEVIAIHEPKLWDAHEKAVHQEAREASISMPLMAQNHQVMDSYLERQGVSLHNLKERVPQMYRWQGLPEDASMPKGALALDDIE